jgi:hypothetical protein
VQGWADEEEEQKVSGCVVGIDVSKEWPVRKRWFQIIDGV